VRADLRAGERRTVRRTRQSRACATERRATCVLPALVAVNAFFLEVIRGEAEVEATGEDASGSAHAGRAFLDQLARGTADLERMGAPLGDMRGAAEPAGTLRTGLDAMFEP